MTKMEKINEKINELADLYGRVAIESRKLALAKHEGKSTEELHEIEENMRKLDKEIKKIGDMNRLMLEKYEEQKGGQ